MLPKHVFLFLLLGLTACSGPSKKVEQETMACWSSKWTQGTEKTLEEGITALDNYLADKGWLGKQEIEDYNRFAADTGKVYIPPSTPGFKKIQLVLGGAFAGAPDVGAMGKCFDDNWISKLETLDSTDVICRTGRIVKAMRDAGAPDVNSARIELFKNMTKGELHRPLVLATYYVLLCAHRFRFE